LFGAPDCTSANDIAMADDGKSGWVACEGDHVGPGSVVFFDPIAMGVLGSVRTGVFPLEMGTMPSKH
jgi:hypothetical protein